MNEQHEPNAEKVDFSNSCNERAADHMDTAETQNRTQKHGHSELLSMEQGAKMDDLTTVRATYAQHQRPGVRHRERRIELLKKQIAQSAREHILQQMEPVRCEPEYRSVTKESFSVPGFVPRRERRTPEHHYGSQDAISFWSENLQLVQGVSPVPSVTSPFRKCSNFSRPISERLDEVDPPVED